MGFGVWGVGLRVWGLGFRVWGLGFRVYLPSGPNAKLSMWSAAEDAHPGLNPRPSALNPEL